MMKWKSAFTKASYRSRCFFRSMMAFSVAGAAFFCNACAPVSNEADNIPAIREENKLVVYTSHKEAVYGPIVREFEERTGIWVQVKTGGTMELLETIASEEGEAACDVMFGGGVESYEAYGKYFEAYECKDIELLDNTFRSKNDIWTVFSELPIVFIYNTKLVSEEMAPKSWEDLLQDKWRGKIAFADPGNSGVSCTALLTMCQVLDLESEQLIGELVSQLDGHIASNSQAVIDEVTAGTELVGVTLEETAMRAMKQGADIAMIYPEEGTSAVPDGVALVKNAAHADNARLFIDFTVSKDVQSLLEEQCCRRSVRTDVGRETDWENIAIADFDLDWASGHQAEILDWWDRLTEQEDRI